MIRPLLFFCDIVRCGRFRRARRYCRAPARMINECTWRCILITLSEWARPWLSWVSSSLPLDSRSGKWSAMNTVTVHCMTRIAASNSAPSHSKQRMSRTSRQPISNMMYSMFGSGISSTTPRTVSSIDKVTNSGFLWLDSRRRASLDVKSEVKSDRDFC